MVLVAEIVYIRLCFLKFVVVDFLPNVVFEMPSFKCAFIGYELCLLIGKLYLKSVHTVGMDAGGLSVAK